MTRALLPAALLCILIASPTLAQRTMTVVSSDPADSSIQAEAFNYGYGSGRSWLAINTIALFNGSMSESSQTSNIAPYLHVGYFRAVAPKEALGGGLELSLEGKHPGIFLTARGFSTTTMEGWFGAWNFSYRTFGDAGELWKLSYSYGLQGMIADKIVIAASANLGYAKASAPNPGAYAGAPNLQSGFGVSLSGDIGYVF